MTIRDSPEKMGTPFTLLNAASSFLRISAGFGGQAARPALLNRVWGFNRVNLLTLFLGKNISMHKKLKEIIEQKQKEVTLLRKEDSRNMADVSLAPE